MPAKQPSPQLQEHLALLARTIDASRKKWWAEVREVRNQDPGPVPLPPKLRVKKAHQSLHEVKAKITKRKPLDKFLHILNWKISYLHARTKLLKRFGYPIFDITLERHMRMFLRPAVSTETETNRIYNALRQTDSRLNGWEKQIKQAEIAEYQRFKALRDRAREASRELGLLPEEQTCVERIGEALVHEEREVTRVAGRWRREVLEVMRWMETLGVRVKGGRQRMITEFLS